MPKRSELYNAMLNGSSSDALILTCMHLHENTTVIMEEEWINFSALIGKTPEFPYGSLWNQINKNILDFIDAEEVDAKDAMVCTIQLMLLYKRCIEINAKSQPLTINMLRQKVIHLFPEKAVLSAAGLIKYKDILSVLNDIKNSETSSESDISLFCQRILAGLSKVMSENNYDDMRYCLEYLCKKKIAIPLPTLYPCPNMEEAERGEIIWFIWGALMCFYGDKNGSYKYNEATKTIVFTNYTLFVTHWKRTTNKERVGLLWGVPYALNTNVIPEWTYTEKVILDKLNETGAEMWKSFVLDQQVQITENENAQNANSKSNSNSKSKGKGKNKKQNVDLNIIAENDPLDILSSYIPRKETYDDDDDDDEAHEKMLTNLQTNSLQKLQYNQQNEERENKLKSAALYDKQLDKLEKHIPYVKTLYLDKNNKFTTSEGATNSKKNKHKQQNTDLTDKIAKTELLIRTFDSKTLGI